MDLHSPSAEYGAGSIVDLLTTAAAALERTVDHALAPLGLSQRSLCLLELLGSGALSARELTLIAGGPGDDVRTALSNLETRGYIERPAGGRPSGFVLTDAGRRATDVAQQAAARAAEGAGTSIRDLRTQLAALIEALEPAGESEPAHAADEE